MWHAARRSRCVALAGLAALAALAGGCADRRGGQTAGERPDTVRVLMSDDPASLSLLGKADRNAEILAVQLTDSLVQYDPQLRLVPRLAESWEMAVDEGELTFHMRPGVRWHDGAPVTAGDVVFSVDLVRDPATENLPLMPAFETLEEIEALDPLTVRARYSQMKPDVLEGWRLPIVPRHLLDGQDLLTGEFSRHPVGCGPFRFVRARPGEEIVLEANDDYWDGGPSIDRLVFRIFPDQRTAYQSLLTGGLHMMVVDPNLLDSARPLVEKGALERFDYSSLSLWHLMWNVDGSNPFFEDPRVRTAMVLALDRPRFIETVLGGRARPAITSYHPDLFWADPSLEPLAHDPERARQLLDEAGWRDENGDGVRERDGVPFRFTLTVGDSTQPVVNQMLAWQQQSWTGIGVRADIEKLEFQTFRQRRREHAFQAVESSFHFTPSPDQYELYHSSARDDGVNYGGFADAEVDRLLELGRRTFDDEERLPVYRALQRRLHELQPLGGLFHFSSPALHHPELEGIEPSPLDHYRTTQGPRVWRWAAGQPED